MDVINIGEKGIWIAALLLYFVGFGLSLLDNSTLQHPTTLRWKYIDLKLNREYYFIITYDFFKICRMDDYSKIKLILINNLESVVLTVMGGVALSIPTVVSTLYNGYLFGSFIGGALASGLSLIEIIKLTVFHGFIEIAGFLMATVAGMRISLLLKDLLISLPEDQDFSKKMRLKIISIMKLFLYSLIFITIAGLIEVYISIDLILCG